MTPLQPNDIHVWSTDLQISPEQESTLLAGLSPDECERAERFRFPDHRRRFIAARATLREILGLYLQIEPRNIAFAYNEHHKPYLQTPSDSGIQFNLAHSREAAVYAFTLQYEIGIDIEKIEAHYNPAIAERYFSKQENLDLAALPEDQQSLEFYKLWSGKEAMIKALGKGLVGLPLSSFSIRLNLPLQTIAVNDQSWQLLTFDLLPDFASALATNQPIKTIHYWSICEHVPQFSKLSSF